MSTVIVQHQKWKIWKSFWDEIGNNTLYAQQHDAFDLVSSMWNVIFSFSSVKRSHSIRHFHSIFILKYIPTHNFYFLSKISSSQVQNSFKVATMLNKFNYFDRKKKLGNFTAAASSRESFKSLLWQDYNNKFIVWDHTNEFLRINFMIARDHVENCRYARDYHHERIIEFFMTTITSICECFDSIKIIIARRRNKYLMVINNFSTLSHSIHIFFLSLRMKAQAEALFSVSTKSETFFIIWAGRKFLLI